MSRYDDVDLSALSAPNVVEELSYEAILQDMKDDLVERDPDFTADVLESDPAVKILEVAAYRELLLRQRVNDAARAVMLAYASGADLENLAANMHVTRQVVDPGDPDALPPVDPTFESDARLRARVQLAMEGLSTAGPDGAYEFHAFSADTRVADVDVDSPAPGEVLVTVLSTDGDGVPAQDLLDIVAAALNDKDVRPLTDQITVQAGAKIDYIIDATLTLYDGPDAEVVRQASEDAVTVFAADQKRLGEPVTIDGLHKALRVAGVKKVTLTAPVDDVTPTSVEFANATSITVTVEA